MSRSNAFAEILEYVPDLRGGFERKLSWGTESCSSEGMDQLILHANILEHWRDHFEALEAVFAHCPEHGLALGEHSWWVNDYVCDPERDPAHVDFILYGQHDALAGSDGFGLCFAAQAHSVPAGLLVEFEGVGL